MGTGNYNLPLITGTASAKVPRDLNALANAVDGTIKGVEERLNKPKTVEQVVEKMLNKQPVVIVTYGDSVTWGYIPSTGGKTANPYPETLQALLREYYGYTGITVYNEGDSGKQSDEFASDAYVARVTSKNPDLVIFMCGINDSRGGTSGGAIVPVKDYKDNIALMTSKLPYPLIFMTPTFYQDDEDRKYRFQQYVRAMREMAKTLNVKLIDLHDIVLKDIEKRELAFKDIAPDNVHYTNTYYQKLADFVFVFGLMPFDISVKDEMFIQPLSPLFRWKTSANNYYTSSINPLKQNILLDYANTNFNQLTMYLFVERNDLSLQPLHVSNVSTAPTNSITVNGVSYPTYQAVSNGQTIFKLRGNSIPLSYGLNKIIFNTNTDGASKTLALFYGMNIIKQANAVAGKRQLLEGAFPIQSSADFVQKNTKIYTFKENDFTKISVKFTPAGINSGIAFGTGSFLKDGLVKEYPLTTVLHGGSDNTKLFDLRMNNNTAFFNNGSLVYSELFVNAAKYVMNQENDLTVTLNSTNYVFSLNGVALFTLPKTTLNLGVMDVWGYSVGTSVCTINSITIES